MRKFILPRHLQFVNSMRKTRNSLEATTHLPHEPEKTEKKTKQIIKKEPEEEETKPKISPRFSFKNSTTQKFVKPKENRISTNPFKLGPETIVKKENPSPPKAQKTITKKSSPKKKNIVIEYEEEGEGIEGENPIKKEEKKIKRVGPPDNWEIVYNLINEERSKKAAPVDGMGCGSNYERTVDDKTRRYQVLISLMLSSQTKDEVNYKAMRRLQAHGLSPENINNTPESQIVELIKPVMYYNRKAKCLFSPFDIIYLLLNFYSLQIYQRNHGSAP